MGLWDQDCRPIKGLNLVPFGSGLSVCRLSLVVAHGDVYLEVAVTRFNGSNFGVSTKPDGSTRHVEASNGL